MSPFPTPTSVLPLKGRKLKHTEVLGNERLIVAHLVAASSERDAPGVEQYHVVGERKRQLYVLFDEHDRLPLLLQTRNGAADFGDDPWCQALRGLVHEEHAR